MSRIKPHGPVSPQFMTHHYGAAKPAPATDDTALLRQALGALEWASGVNATTFHYRPLHDAITALRERLGEKV